MSQPLSFIVVGGGLVGLATALKLQDQFPGTAVTVLEKEPEVGRHQSTHNSGVLQRAQTSRIISYINVLPAL